ncbi:MAG: DUF4136 domain-containing protein [Spirosomataceae bacterium]
MKKSFFVLSKNILFLGVLMTVWGACTPDPLKDLTPEETQVFITNYEKNTKFGDYKTFSLADSVFTLQNQRSGVSTLPLDFRMLGSVTNNMAKRGYNRVSKTSNPDLGINVVRISETQSGVVANYNPWNSYWGFGGGVGGGFYYPPTYSYYQTTETYWHLEIVDLKKAQAGQQASIIWNAQIRGSGIFDESTVATIVDNVFAQSDYLKRN